MMQQQQQDFLRLTTGWLWRARQCAHPECGLQLDLAVGPRTLQWEALVHAHVGGGKEATEVQIENAELRLLLVLFDLRRTKPKQRTIKGLFLFLRAGLKR